MDGTGLHERPDWPLRQKKVVDSGVIAVPGNEDPVDDRAVIRQPGEVEEGSFHEAYVDVSDMEEDDKTNGEGRSQHECDSILERSTIDQSIEDEDDEQDAKVVRRSRYFSNTTYLPRPDVSPAPSDRHSVISNISTGLDGSVSPLKRYSGALGERLLDPSQIRGASPLRHDGGSGRGVGSTGVDLDEERDSLTALREEGTESSYSTIDRSSFSDRTQRDATTPLATPILGSDHTWSPRSPPQPSTPQMNGSSRLSATFKGTPPHPPSKRSSLNFNTIQTPSNRTKVRYSWQSIQDDEPNRPRIHIIKLVSNTATASAGFPGGEAFGFSISPSGRRIAAYNSARLYILQTAALPVDISQDYALKRRPLAVEIADEGDVVAILADEHTVNVYDLRHQSLRRTNTIKLDFPTNCIALAPTGGLLAAAYAGGVEIFSLDPSALPTDRRAVRSEKVDRLTFSEDGSTLLGTTTRINAGSTVTVSVPVFPSAPNGVPSHEELKEAWCSDLLHPENIRNSSHAAFLREKRTTCNDRLFAWNGLADTFGILNVADMQYGNVDFPIVISPPLSTCGGLGAAISSCPAVDENGDTVAMIVNDRTVRLYIVPERSDDDGTSVEAHSIDHELDEGYGCPFSEVRWVYSSSSLPGPASSQAHIQGRLLVTSPGGVMNRNSLPEETVEDLEGGRIILFDFDPQFSSQPGQTFTITLGKKPAKTLEEPEIDVENEVALVRRRTVNQSKGGGLSQKPAMLGRAATNFSRQGRGLVRASTSPLVNLAANSNRRSVISMHSLQSEATRSLPDLLETTETNEVFEEPYAQNAPRSHASLQRAASNVQRHRYQTIEERNQEHVSVDSSGHFLALPEYTEEPNAPLPSRFRALAGLDTSVQPSYNKAAAQSSSSFTDATPAASSSGFPLMSAPAALAATFSSEQAFIAAGMAHSPPREESRRPQTTIQRRLSMQNNEPRTHVSPLRIGPYDSIEAMPRSLQRAYSNAISPIGHGPPPSLIGDWENVSPLMSHQSSRTFAPSPSSIMINGNVSRGNAAEDDESWNAISPVVPRSQRRSQFLAQPSQFSTNSSRYSMSSLDTGGHATPTRQRDDHLTSTTERRMPPHVRAFQNAAATSPSSSTLFPPTQRPDHVPYRQPSSHSGSVAHPITAWHPPASSPASPPPTAARSAHSASTARPSSRGNATIRSTLASASLRSKRGGVFRRNKKLDQFGPSGDVVPQDSNGRDASRLETKSMFAVKMGKESKCTLM
ncbi:Hypothetical protein R9X50_00372400 [Acrodontium crateriforme]|uniref:DUF7165 domain-containing protein n=1 Tax=Acrodontium crateriforme TaxID=150365 RepID=A0AAQ3M4T6_9PEZI|nr:Hypothetical protein R9X50_00372400 [Acrodontium crateriforme]